MSDAATPAAASTPPARSPERLVIAILAIIAAGLLIGGFFVWRNISRNVSQTTACVENFKKIVLAIHAYHDTYSCFPPAHFADQKGRPLHSWRVLILPFLGEQRLFAKYRLTEPWDSPHNRQLAEQMPDVFRCPADFGKSTSTSYVVVTGAGTVFPGTRCRRIADVMDGTRNTILFVETTNSGVPWMEPRDLADTDALAGINSKTRGGIASEHGHVAFVATVDGSIWPLPENLSRDTLDKLLQCNDGQMIPDFGTPRGSATEPAPPVTEIPARDSTAIYK